MDIGMGSPFVGVGLNNYKIHMARRAPEWEWALNMEEYSIKQLHIRPIAAPHNGFLAIFAETGILGLGSYGIYLLGVLRITLKAIRSTEGYLKSACFGVLLGFLGLIAQQAIDFSLWVDPLLYTFPIMIGMANAAPSLFGGPDGDGGVRGSDIGGIETHMCCLAVYDLSSVTSRFDSKDTRGAPEFRHGEQRFGLCRRSHP